MAGGTPGGGRTNGLSWLVRPLILTASGRVTIKLRSTMERYPEISHISYNHTALIRYLDWSQNPEKS